MNDLYRRWLGLGMGLRLLTLAGVLIAVSAVIAVGAPAFVSGFKSGYDSNKAASTPTPTAAHSSKARVHTPAATVGRKAAKDIPALDNPGDPECVIAYRDNGDGTMTWVVTVTEDGDLITHVSDTDGTLYRHDEHVAKGANAFRATVPLSRINDIGGTLNTGSRTYGCSTGPDRG